MMQPCDTGKCNPYYIKKLPLNKDALEEGFHDAMLLAWNLANPSTLLRAEYLQSLRQGKQATVSCLLNVSPYCVPRLKWL